MNISHWRLHWRRQWRVRGTCKWHLPGVGHSPDMRQRDYLNSPIFQDDFRAALEHLGAWEAVSSLVVPVRRERDLLHFGRGTHRRAVSTPVQEIAVGDLTGRWCSCLVRSHLDPYAEYRFAHPSGALVLLQLAALEMALGDLCDAYALQPSRPLRERLVALTSLRERRHPLSPEVLSSIDPTDLDAEIQEARRAHSQGLRSRVRALLQDTQVNARPRQRALVDLVSSTWLEHVERDGSELLVGLASQVDPTEMVAVGTLLREVLATSMVFSADGVAFLRLPQYAYTFLERYLHDCGLRLQAVPWTSEVDLGELATLWDPTTTSALCSLTRALETLTSL